MKSAKRYRWITSGILAVIVMMFLAVATDANAAAKKKAGAKKPVAKKQAPARKKGKGDKFQKNVSDEEIYAKMEFTGEQREKFDAARQKLQTALDAWDATPKGQKLTELQAKIELAKTPEEKRKVAGLLGQIRGLLAERRVIERRYEPQIIATLAPEQKATRLGYKLCNKVLSGKLGSVLKGDQVNKLRSYCMQAGTSIVKGSLSVGRAEARLQSLAVGLLNDEQKKKLGLSVTPKKEEKKNKNRRPTQQQIDAYRAARKAGKKN